MTRRGPLQRRWDSWSPGEEVPLERAAEAYAAMEAGRARYRMVLTA